METSRRTLLAAGAALATTAGVQAARAQSAPRTFVLVHGSWHGGWCWRRVADRLEKLGVEDELFRVGAVAGVTVAARGRPC